MFGNSTITMPSTRFTRMLPVLALLIPFLMLFARLGQLPLRDPDEGRNAEVAREMRDSGAWLVPTYNGIAYLDKPAFFFRLVALSFSWFGESETTARLPSAMFASALLAMVFAFCRREYRDTTAFLAVIIVATTPLFFALGRHVIFDMTLAFFVSAAILSGYMAEVSDGRKRRVWYLAGSAAAGFATLVKGPIGFLLPTLVLAVFNIVDGRRGWVRRYLSPWNLLLFFGIVLPWFIGVSRLRPDFPYYGIVEESFHRFTKPSFRRTAPFYYYGLVVLGGFFTWSVLVPEAALAAWRARSKWSRADRLLVVWAVVVVVFFSISKSKLPAYILTGVVALGILTARLFVAALDKRVWAERLILRGVLVLELLSVALAIFLAINVSIPDAAKTLFRIHSNEFDRVSLIFGPALLVTLLVALGAAGARWSRDIRVAFATFLLLPLILISVGFSGLLDYSEASSARRLSLRLPELAASAQVVCVEAFPCGLPFYLKQFVTVLTQDGTDLTSNYIVFSLKKISSWPETVIPLAERDKWLANRQNAVYLLSNKRWRLSPIADARGGAITEITPGWWGMLLPPARK